MGGIDTYTKLLLHCNGVDASTTFTDVSLSLHGNASIVGTAQVDTAKSKFGGASLLVDGDSDYITYSDHDDWDLGAGAFSIDFWMYKNANPAVNECHVGQYGLSGARGWVTRWNVSDNNLGITYNNGSIVHAVVATAINIGEWYHIAMCRSGNNLYIFKNGVLQGSPSMTGTINNAGGNLEIGACSQLSYYFNGWLDEVRISKGIARWTSDFTVPVYEYNDYKDIGLRIKKGSGTQIIPVQDLLSSHKLRFNHEGTIYGIPLVATTHYLASALRIYDGSAVKCIPLEAA